MSSQGNYIPLWRTKELQDSLILLNLTDLARNKFQYLFIIGIINPLLFILACICLLFVFAWGLSFFGLLLIASSIESGNTLATIIFSILFVLQFIIYFHFKLKDFNNARHKK